MNTFIRALSLLLALLMMSSVLVACGNKDDDGKEGNSGDH